MSKLILPSDLLGPPQTADYTPNIYQGTWQYIRRLPPFTLHIINDMLADARLKFGLWLIKGPILARAKFYVDPHNDPPEVKEWLLGQITRFWRNSAPRALRAIEWGYSCAEVIWRVEDGMISFHTTRDLHPLDCRVVTQKGDMIGATVRNVPGKKKLFLPGPKKFWHIHDRETHPWYGRSRFFGAYLPWIEKWSDGGYRDSRRLYFHKYAFDGGTLYHPPGSSNLDFRDDTGLAVKRSNKDIAREMIEKKKSGASMTLPNIILDNSGARAWEYQPPSVTAPPQHIMDYGEDLGNEELEGMGIPPEVANASDSGSGFAGRRIPQQAFYAILQEVLFNLIADADQQLFRPGVRMNFGIKEPTYEIVPFGLLRDEEQGEDDATAQGAGADLAGQPGTDNGIERGPAETQMSVPTIAEIAAYRHLAVEGTRASRSSQNQVSWGRRSFLEKKVGRNGHAH